MTNNHMIADSFDIAEAHELGEEDDCSNLEATQKPTDSKLEFYVQMRGHTLTDMETLIVEAAARQLLRSFANAKAMEDRILEALYLKVTSQIQERISIVASDVLSTVMVGGKEPVTVKQFIEMSWRDWLQKRVDREGKDLTGYHGAGTAMTRVEWLLWRALEAKWARDVATATNAAVAEMQKAVTAKHTEILTAEKTKLAAALAKLTGGQQ